MSKPYIHAKNSARKFGGKTSDYLEIHQFMDSSKSSYGSNAHRVLTHNSWFIGPGGPLEKAFGLVITNSDGKEVSVRDIGEQHVSEDFHGFIPTVADYLNHLEFHPWMSADFSFGKPPSALEGRVTTRIPNVKPKEEEIESLPENFNMDNVRID